MKIFILIAVLYLGPLLAIGSTLEENNWLGMQTIAIILTGLIIIWYTIETYLLRKETQKQTELQQRPFLLAKLEDQKLCLTNYGSGVALNAYVKPIVIDEVLNIKVKFKNTVPVIKENEHDYIKAESFHNGVSKGDFFVAHLDPENAVYELTIEIVYENVEGKRYTTKQKSSPKNLKILGIETK